ncbi:MAG: hypothetical protein WD669_07930 [Pirellulales bacterium]
MKYLSAIALVLISCIVHAQEVSLAQEISLKSIWARDMPHTIDIRALEPDCFGDVLKGASSAEQVRLQERSLLNRTMSKVTDRDGKQIGSAFAVRGAGLDALKKAHAVLALNEKPTNIFRAQDEVSIVFFSQMSGASVHLQRVYLEGSHVEIRYRFVPHLEAYMSNNLALIPLPKLPAGEIDVAITKLPLDQKARNFGASEVTDEQASRIVCKSFRFVVEGAD